MGWAVSFMVIILAGGLCVIVTLLVQHHVEINFRRRNHEVGTTMFLQLGVVFAVLLAFVFSEVWGEYNEAAHAVSLEGNALQSMGVLAATLPPDKAGTILTAARDYLDNAINSEWPLMAKSRILDRKTNDRLDRLAQYIAGLRLPDPDQNATKGRIATFLAAAQAARDTRIFETGYGVPFPLWSLLIVFSIVLSFFASLSQIEDKMAAIFVSVSFTLGIASILVLVRLLDYPFEGALALKPTEFMHAREQLSNLLVRLSASP